MRRALALMLLASATVINACVGGPPGGAGPERPRLDSADYARAERHFPDRIIDHVLGFGVNPTWLPDGRFWYANRFEDGVEIIFVDPGSGRRARAFDQERMAQALTSAIDSQTSAFDLPPLQEFDGAIATFSVSDTLYACDTANYECGIPGPTGPRLTVADAVSPDGRLSAFMKDHQLWLRDLESGQETPLTDDGVEELAYAKNSSGWERSPYPVLKWSPDSRRIKTFRLDERGVGVTYLVRTQLGHPHLVSWKYPMPGDSVILRLQRVIIDVEAPAGQRVTNLAMPADQHRSTVCDNVFCNDEFVDVEWAADGRSVAFVSSSRDHKRALVRIADAETGAVTDVFEEVADTYFESGGNWRYLSRRGQILWQSQRDNWAHLYLYDVATGELLHQVTSGEWNVHKVLEVDEDAGEVTFIGNHREPGAPYFQYLYRVPLDGGEPRLLTPDSATHVISWSPDRQYFVDVASTPTIPPVSVLRDRDGNEITTLETADISRLTARNWTPPTPFTVKARDGETDIYGLLFRPHDFDPGRKYPVINYLYPGPGSGSVGSRAFLSTQAALRSLAELGFVVIELDAMGTPMRSKAFADAVYGDLGDNGLPDQIAGIRELAERHPWIDVDRVGIYGHSGGGYAAAAGILRYPDFYKVAVAQAGNHDNRNYEDDWGEKWQGLLETYPDGTSNYDNQANPPLAANLEGKLLLAYGTMDPNVPPSNSLLLVDALVAANKDFDLVVLPNRTHIFDGDRYMMRRRWDHFVRHLMGADPPPTYEFDHLDN